MLPGMELVSIQLQLVSFTSRWQHQKEIPGQTASASPPSRQPLYQLKSCHLSPHPLRSRSRLRSMGGYTAWCGNRRSRKLIASTKIPTRSLFELGMEMKRWTYHQCSLGQAQARAQIPGLYSGPSGLLLLLLLIHGPAPRSCACPPKGFAGRQTAVNSGRGLLALLFKYDCPNLWILSSFFQMPNVYSSGWNSALWTFLLA